MSTATCLSALKHVAETGHVQLVVRQGKGSHGQADMGLDVGSDTWLLCALEKSLP